MTLPPQPALHNQSGQSDEDFVANFTARQNVLDLLCRRLASVNSASDAHHQIIIGPRGMGKTSLLRRIAIEVNSTSALADRFVPLNFREEQYNVLSLGDFWRNCGEALAEWAETHGKADLAHRLDADLISAGWSSNEGAAERFQAEMTALERRAVLLVDNVDLIINSLADADRWTMRRHLQMRNGPIMIGAATQPLTESAEREAAFYEFFQPHYLEPLDAAETEACMRALAKRRGNFGVHVLKVLDAEPARLKTLHTLTGGNPRVLTLIYRLLEAAESDATMADLDILLDQVTPYYKSRIEEYQTPLQRATIDAIALHWDPITTSDLSRITNVPTTTLSPLLIKMRKDGLIEQVETSGTYSGHQIVERFLNIWYLMRHGTRRTKQKMRWLVAFLTSFYSRRDLVEIDRHAKSRSLADRWHKDYTYAFEQALQNRLQSDKPVFMGEDSIELKSASLASKARGGGFEKTPVIGETENTDDLLHEGRKASRAGEHHRAIAHFEALIARFGETTEPELQVQVAQAMIGKGISLGNTGEPAAEIRIYDALIARFGEATEPEIQVQVAKAMVNKGITLGQAGEHAAKIGIYDALIARFGEATAPEIQRQVAAAMISKGFTLYQTGEHAAAIGNFDALIARIGETTEPEFQVWVAQAMVGKGISLGQIGEYTAAIGNFDALIARFGEATASELQVWVALAMINKGSALRQAGEYAEAIGTFDTLIARFGEATEPEIQLQVALAMINKGSTLSQTGEHAAAIGIYDALIARFSETTEPEIQLQVALAMINKGSTLSQTGEHAAAIGIYDALIARFGETKAPEIQLQVAQATINKAATLSETGEHAAAIGIYDALIARFREATEPMLQARVAQAMFGKGFSLGEAGEHTAAISIYDALIARFGEATEPEILVQVGQAMFGKSILLSNIDEHAAEIQIYDSLIARFGEATEPEIRAQVARAMAYKGITLRQTGEHVAAISIFDAVIARFGEATEPEIQTQVALAMINKGISLDESSEHAAANGIYDALIARFGETIEPEIQLQVARAMINKGFTLHQASELVAANGIYDALIARFGETIEPEIQLQVARAMVSKGISLDQTGEHAAAIGIYDALIARFSETMEPKLQVLVARAMMSKGISLDQLGEHAAAIESSEVALKYVRNSNIEAKDKEIASTSISLANRLFDFRNELDRPESLLLQAVANKPLVAYGNLFWVHVFAGKLSDATSIQNQLGELPLVGRQLADAALALASENFGLAAKNLEAALLEDMQSGAWDFSDDLQRLLRLAEREGYGERLIEWFEKKGFADRVAPVHAAFKAYVRGERSLLDANPEIRLPAKVIFERLSAAKRYQGGKLGPKQKSGLKKTGRKKK